MTECDFGLSQYHHERMGLVAHLQKSTAARSCIAVG